MFSTIDIFFFEIQLIPHEINFTNALYGIYTLINIIFTCLYHPSGGYFSKLLRKEKTCGECKYAVDWSLNENHLSL